MMTYRKCGKVSKNRKKSRRFTCGDCIAAPQTPPSATTLARREQQAREIIARKTVVLEAAAATQAKHLTRRMYLPCIKRGTPGIVFEDGLCQRLPRPDAILVGRSGQGVALAWRESDLSVGASQTRWWKYGWRVREHEEPAEQRSGCVGGGAKQRTWDVYGDWQVEPRRPDATLPGANPRRA